jgi:ankyrin repeat protein
MIVAIECGDEQHMRWCVERGVPATFVMKNVTPIMVAARFGRWRMVQYLVSRGASPRRGGPNQLTPLHIAAAGGHLETARSLVQLGAALDDCDSKGFTPLHYSIIHGKQSVTAYLVAQGSSVSLTAKDGCNALHLAAENPAPEMTQLLLARGCPLDRLGGQGGWTAVQMAAYRRHEDVALCLLRAGADPRVLSSDGHALMHIAVQSGALRVLDQLETMVDVNMRNARREHALHFAVATGNADVARRLLRMAAVDPNARQADGCTPLLFAVLYRRPEIARMLLQDERVRANEGDDVGRTPLIKSCIQNDAEMTRLLLSCDRVDPNAHTELKSYPMHFCAANGHADMARLLFSAGADARAQNGDGMQPIHVASLCGHTGVLRCLVEECGVPHDVKSAKGSTPLQLAAQENMLGALVYLLGLSPSVAAMGMALMTACKKGHSDAVRILWKRGANGATWLDARPTHIAAEYGHADILRDLLAWGEDANAKTRAGHSVRDIALLRKRDGVVRLLDLHGAEPVASS